MAIGLGAALLGSAIIGGGASVIGGNKAAGAQKRAGDANNALQREIYGRNETTLNPYITRGNQAGDILQGLIMGGEGAQKAYQTFQNSTGYQTTLSDALASVNSNAYARGMGDSGATARRLQQTAGQVAQGSFGQFAGLLGNQQGVGLSAASALAGVGQNYANSVSANNNATATAQGNAALNTAGQIGGVLNNATSLLAFNKGLGSSYSGMAPYGGNLGGIY
jgi:hypothetical protein